MMEVSLKKLFDELNFKKYEKFENVRLSNFEIKNNVWQIKFHSQEIIDPESIISFLNYLEHNHWIKTNVVCQVDSPIYSKEVVEPYLNYLIKKISYPAFDQVAIEFKNRVINFIIDSHSVHSYFKSHRNLLVESLYQFGFVDIDINFIVKNHKENIDLSSYDQKRMTQKVGQKIKLVRSNNYRNNKYIDVEMSQLDEIGSSSVSVNGEIFKIDVIETKQGLLIFSFSITDFKEAIQVKFFARTESQKKQYKLLKIGDFVNVFGSYNSYDTFARTGTITGSGINIIKQEEENVENAKSKRVEFSFHTKMSAMNGLSSISEYYNQAKLWGHEAIAIVDDNSVQSFPELDKLSKNSDIKPIYGVTFNTISKNHRLIINPKKETNLKDEEYVVLDIETTGLSPIYNEIIEFGAVKLKNDVLYQEIQFFIKSQQPVTEKITNLTGIEWSILEEKGLEIREALKKIVDYIGDATIVAHNSNFDISFINQKLETHGFEPLKNPVIDTLQVARFLNPESKKFNLKSVSNYYDVNYDELDAHRADYDANVLSRIWIKMIIKLVDEKVETETLLYDQRSRTLYEKAFSKTISVLAENQKGLKKIFELVSKIHTENYFRGPKLFFEEIINDRENILIGSSSLQSRLIELMLFGSGCQVEEEIQKYDYIEILPPSSFVHLIDQELTIENVEHGIKKLISLAKKYHKKVIAIGGVHYLNKKSALAHRILVESKGLEGRRHYLFNYKKNNPVYPDQSFLSTIEMKEKFKFLNDDKLVDEIVVENTQILARQIERVQVIKKSLYTPKLGNENEELKAIVYEEAFKRYGKVIPKYISERIEKELKPIIDYGYAVIYVVSHRLVKKSLNDGYLVGSRGSVGSSFVANLASITEVNPLNPHYHCAKCQFFELSKDTTYKSGFDLPPKKCPNCSIDLDRDGQKIPFETFLGFKGNKVPDIDLNFSGDYQARIHDEVKSYFSETHCFRAGTISTIADRTAYGYVKGWCEETNNTFTPTFITYLALKLVGIKRTTGQHPGGIIVVPNNLVVEDFTPINYPANDVTSSWKTTHFDFESIHDNLLKFDLLGHDDPTMIKDLENLTSVKANQIPKSDPEVISIFSSTEALKISDETKFRNVKTGVLGIPEFGTTFVREMLRSTKVRSFADIVSISGLSHGTSVWTNNAEKLLKDPKKNLTLNDLVSCRDDIMTFLNEKGIDSLEAFKIMEQVRKGLSITPKQEKILVNYKIPSWYIDCLKRIQYLFPKAHATAYVIMAWRIAWYKINFPLEYYATFFSNRIESFDIKNIVGGPNSINNAMNELKTKAKKEILSTKERAYQASFLMTLEASLRGVKIKNVSIQKSDAKKWLIDKDENSLIPPFNIVDGIGSIAAETIVSARKIKQFTSIDDLKKRSKLNGPNIVNLQELGVLNNLQKSNQMAFDLKLL